jgi:hypothetical protein
MRDIDYIVYNVEKVFVALVNNIDIFLLCNAVEFILTEET